MEKIYVPYSYVDEAKRFIRKRMEQGDPDYLPKPLSFDKFEPLLYRATTTDSEGRVVYDSSKPDLRFNWDHLYKVWRIDDSNLDVDGSK